MNKIFYTFIGYMLSLQFTFANGVKDGGFLGDFIGKRGTGTGASNTQEALRTGDIHVSDIPNIIRGAIDFFITIAGTVAIIFIIIGAYKILLGSLEQDKTKGKDTIIMAIGGFAIASLAWFIIKVIIDNLG